MKRIFFVVFFLFTAILFAQKPHIRHFRPKGHEEHLHFKARLNNCRAMGAYNRHHLHPQHVPHGVFVVHQGSSESHPQAPAGHDTSSSAHKDHLASVATDNSSIAPRPDTVKKPAEPEKPKLGPMMSKYEDQLKEIKPGGSISLPPINFVYNQDELAVANMESFMQAVEFGQNGFAVLVEGHTDDKGPDDYNLKLSMKRVERIKQLMMEMGVPEDNISVVGHGERQPLVPNDSDAHRLMNRRIEFKVFKL